MRDTNSSPCLINAWLIIAVPMRHNDRQRRELIPSGQRHVDFESTTLAARLHCLLVHPLMATYMASADSFSDGGSLNYPSSFRVTHYWALRHPCELSIGCKGGRASVCANVSYLSTARGFEPLRAEPNGFRVHHLSHSVTLSCKFNGPRCIIYICMKQHLSRLLLRTPPVAAPF